MMMKAWIRLITKIILPIRVFHSLCRTWLYWQGFWKSGFQSVHQCCCKWRSAVTAGVVRCTAEKQFAIRVGKFKTPFSHAYLTTLGETLLPQLPVSLTSSVILPYSLNAVTPNIGTGFDLGVEVHGLVADKFGYEVGLFNGTGASVNTASKTMSDDWHIPSLLYAGRLTYMPKGVMPSTQGNPNRLNEDKILFGLSGSINVESENESTNDTRVGLEFAMLKNKLYLAAEAYYMNVGFTKRQKINESYSF